MAHIVPYGVGEFNAAYIFGVPVDKGWETIWSYKNGLVLHNRIKQAMDATQLVVVPDGESGDGLKVVVRDDSILDKSPCVGGPKYRDLNHSSLQFKTKTRPLKRYLCSLCLIGLYHRRRFCVDEHERDQQRLAMGKIWGSPGKWMRGSIIQALALEIGDLLQPVEDVGQDADGEQIAEKVSPESERKIAVDIHEAIEEMIVNDDDGNGDDGEEKDDEDEVKH